MRRIRIAGLVVAMLGTAMPMTHLAQAHPSRHYRGGCTFTTVNDTLPTEPLGGQDQWTGEATAVVVATTTDTDPSPDVNNSTPTPTDSISFECTLWRNGTTNLGVILGGSGTGVAADTDTTFTFTAGETDTIQVCEEVIVNGEQHGDASTFNPASCTDSEGTPVVPEPFTILVTTVLTLVIDVANQVVVGPTDVVTCAVLRTLAPTVNTVDPATAYIDPHSGDTDLFETPFWDCPPYGDPPSNGDSPVNCTPEEPGLSAGCNSGDEGLALVTVEPTDGIASRREGPNDHHHLTSACAFRQGSKVVGRTVGGGHPAPSTVEIHCVLKTANGTVVFDEKKMASGSTVEVEFPAPTGFGALTVCTEGSGTWGDSHIQSRSACVVKK